MSREMINTGIQWIGQVPSGTPICRLKFLSYMKGRIGWQGLKSEDFTKEGPYCVTGTDFVNGKINWDTCYHVSEERYEMDSNIHLKIGDLLVTKDGTIGKLAKVTELPDKACLNSHLLIIRPIDGRFTNEYLYYVMCSPIFTGYYRYASTGSIMESLSQKNTGEFAFPLYDIETQHTIVRYLDSKCAAIDEAIERHRRIIEKLAEYNTSFVTHILTKGVENADSYVPSEIQQIGSIPSHWKVLRIKHLLSDDAVNLRVGPFGSALSTNEYTDNGPWVYTQRTVLDENFEENSVHISEDKYNSLEGFAVNAGDLLVTTRGTIGKLAIVPSNAPKGILHPCLIKFRVDQSRIHHRILKYLFNDTDLIMNQIRKKAEGATIEALYSGPLKDVYIPLAPYTEQIKMLDLLDAQTRKIQNGIQSHESVIKKLEEYRKSIIYNAVTGKIDCRTEV